MQKIRSYSLFFGVAFTGTILLILFVYLSQKQLLGTRTPRENVIHFYRWNKYLTIGNYIVYLLLLLMANIMYIRRRYWDTFIWAGIVFAVFALADWWWLGEAVFQYKKGNDLWLGEFSIGPFVGIMLALFGLLLAIGNHQLLKRLVRERNIPATRNTDEENTSN